MCDFLSTYIPSCNLRFFCFVAYKVFQHFDFKKPALDAALLVENGKFLLSAKRTRRTTCTEYVISMDVENISRSSNSYIGKLR